ncbi:MAG TPA: PP2C family serine/threonine-protein phosphatase [Blastocatellia bacterium]|nr:PP2C family serine/threonine-protein phosphatase [Blastocatellia bacterium]
MATGTHNSVWRITGRTVRGASHHRSGLPNQDAIGWLQRAGSSPWSIVAVSDGHGSAKYFRSHVGSQLAIDTSLALVQEFIKGQPDINNLSLIKRTAEDRLPREMSRRWREAVEKHIEDHPFSEEELAALEGSDGTAAREAITKNPVHAYGATILTVLVQESFILYFQLGDGDILLVSDAGEVERPLSKDERLFANETTSLSSRDAWPDFRLSFQTLAGPPPALILLSTDGYANSFVSEEAFLKVGKDLLEMIRAEGLDKVEANLEGWLTEASQAGSGDDITLALIGRADALRGEAVNSSAEEVPATTEETASNLPASSGETSDMPAQPPAESAPDAQQALTAGEEKP